MRCTNKHCVDFVSKSQVVAIVEVRPRTEKLITCRLLNKLCSPIGLIESTKTTYSYSLAFAASVCTCSQNEYLWAKCMDPFEQPLHVNTGTVIGKCTSLDSVQVIDNQAICCVQEKNSVQQFLPLPAAHITSVYGEATKVCSQQNNERQLPSCYMSSATSVA